MAVILDAEMGKSSMRAGMMGNHHINDSGLRPSRPSALPKPNGSTLDKRGGLRLVSSKVFLSPNVRLSDETWRNIRSGPCWNPLGTQITLPLGR